jgi:hypothetical protein
VDRSGEGIREAARPFLNPSIATAIVRNLRYSPVNKLYAKRIFLTNHVQIPFQGFASLGFLYTVRPSDELDHFGLFHSNFYVLAVILASLLVLPGARC